HRGRAVQVTLLADRFGPLARQVARVDDRVIDAFGVVVVAALGAALAQGVLLHVQRAGPVAALAADGRLLDLDAVLAFANRFRLPRMAAKAPFADRPLEALVIGAVVTRRHLPRLARGVPGHRRLQEKAVRLDQIRARVPARADRVLERVFRQHYFLGSAR